MSASIGDREIVAACVRWARSPAERMRGLIGRSLGRGEALVIEGARQVHTIGLARPIDVVFCDEAGVVVGVVRRMRPNRVGRFVARARVVVELEEEAAASVSTGDRIAVEGGRLLREAVRPSP